MPSHLLIYYFRHIIAYISALRKKDENKDTRTFATGRNRTSITLWDTVKMMSPCLPKPQLRQEQTAVALHHIFF